MQRQKLSQKILFTAIILVLIGLLFFFFGIQDIRSKETIIEGVFLLIISSSPLYKGISFLWYPITLEFDNEYLYVIKRNEIKQIPLSNVYKIKLIMMRFNYRFFWKVEYLDEYGTKKSIRFLPNHSNNAFSNFQTKVKEQNPDVGIKKWSWSFDFDQ